MGKISRDKKNVPLTHLFSYLWFSQFSIIPYSQSQSSALNQMWASAIYIEIRHNNNNTKNGVIFLTAICWKDQSTYYPYRFFKVQSDDRHATSSFQPTYKSPPWPARGQIQRNKSLHPNVKGSFLGYSLHSKASRSSVKSVTKWRRTAVNFIVSRVIFLRSVPWPLCHRLLDEVFVSTAALFLLQLQEVEMWQDHTWPAGSRHMYPDSRS